MNVSSSGPDDKANIFLGLIEYELNLIQYELNSLLGASQPRISSYSIRP